MVLCGGCVTLVLLLEGVVGGVCGSYVWCFGWWLLLMLVRLVLPRVRVLDVVEDVYMECCVVLLLGVVLY